MSAALPQFETQDGPDALQELYRYLDNVQTGNMLLAWYGQSRAKGMDHAKAMVDTIQHWGLESQRWFQVRLAGG